MDRLTVKYIDEPIFVPDEEKWLIDDEFGAICLCGEVVDRLAAYEDTGLTPEEIAELESQLAQERKRVKELEGSNQCLETDYAALQAELEQTRKALELACECGFMQDSEKAVQVFLAQAKEVLK